MIGVSSCGFSTTPLPAPSAGATDFIDRKNGKLNGLIDADDADRDAVEEVLALVDGGRQDLPLHAQRERRGLLEHVEHEADLEAGLEPACRRARR